MHPIPTSVLITVLCLFSVACTSQKETKHAKPSTQIDREFITQAEITGIDSERRLVSIRRADGSLFTFKAHPALNNFDKLRVGDVIEVDVHQSVVLQVSDKDDAPDEIDIIAGQSDEGAMPAVGAAEVIHLKATVVEVDYETRNVTLKTPEGYTTTFRVSHDVTDLESVEPGDIVTAKITLAIAIMARHVE